jgi:hypothetical protein
MTKRRLLSGLLIAAAVTLSAVSGLVYRDFRQTNDLFFLFPMQLLALPLAGAVAGRRLRSRRDLAPAMLGVGIYLMTVAYAVSTIYSMWLPNDDTILAQLCWQACGRGSAQIWRSPARQSSPAGHQPGRLLSAGLVAF